MPGLAYKIGEKIVLLEALHVFLITYLQGLCYSVQTVERSSIYQRRTKRQSSASNAATPNRYPVLAVTTWLMVETELIRTAYDDIAIVTQSREDAFPSELRQKRKSRTRIREAVETRPIVSTSRPCCQMLMLMITSSLQETIVCRRCCHDKGYTMEKQVCQALFESLCLLTEYRSP